jgi:hypothetical protein
MIEVVFEKDRYHTIGTMERWCAENIGLGGWVYGDPDDWEEGKRKWAITSIFGRTTFYFKDDEDATMFTLRWT